MIPSAVGDQGQIEYFEYNGKTEKPKVVFHVPVLVNDNASPDKLTVGEHTSDLYLPTVIALWLAYVLFCRDIELACDERVIRDMDRDGIAAYSQALLDCSLPSRRLAACPLAFGEVGVKERWEP